MIMTVSIRHAIIANGVYTIPIIVSIVGKHVTDNAQKMVLCDLFLCEFSYRMHTHARARIWLEMDFIANSGWIFNECVKRVEAEYATAIPIKQRVSIKYLKGFIVRHNPPCDHSILLTRLKRYYGAK